jgi:RNA polymerase sigma factor (sigma-70 family)
MDVGALLQRVIDGDQWAWDEIVGQFGGLVWSVARSYRLGASTDDVVQTVWLRLAEHCADIREPERLAAWLATTTRNEALRVATREGRVLQRADVVEQPDPAVALLDELAVDDDTLAHVMVAFRQLSERDQQLLRLVCAVPVLDYATIAELLDRSIGSIGPSRARALDKLRKLLPTGLYDGPATIGDETS